MRIQALFVLAVAATTASASAFLPSASVKNSVASFQKNGARVPLANK
jgi:hypothetical protein